MNETKNKNTWFKVLLCLPLVLIVFFAVSLSGKGIDADKVISIDVTLPDGNTASYTKRDDVDFFINMYMEADPIGSPLRDINGVAPMSVSIKQKSESIQLYIYPEINTNGCFFADAAGKYFAIPSGIAKDFLQRSDCAYVYRDEGYMLPTLTFVSDSGESGVLPDSYEWEYIDISKNKVKDTLSLTADTEQQLRFSNGTPFETRFSVMPDEQNIWFYDEDGGLVGTNAQALLFTDDTLLTVKMEAKWKNEGKVGYGSATYTFKLLCDVLPEIRCTATSVTAGDVIRVDFTHLSESETVVLETLLKTTEIKPVFEGDTAWALIPVSLENTENGVYTLNFKIGDYSPEPINVFVSGASSGFDTATMDTALFTEFRTPDVMAYYSQLESGWAEHFTVPSAEPSSSFMKPCGGTVLHEFGADLLINALSPSVKVNGIDYALTAGDSVKATERGTVIYAETDKFYGNMLVIDHGYGILSHYYNLGSTDKAVGDTVTVGEIIGTAGVSGMVYMDGAESTCMLHFAISVGGVFVNPEPFLSGGIPD